MANGLMRCEICGLLSGPYQHDEAECPQCGAEIEYRKPNSYARAWALLIASIIFYIPANLLPVTKTTTLGATSGQTIMDGVIYFMHAGEWPIALVIFTASILVPTVKIMIIIYLLICAQRKSKSRPGDRIRLYHFTEFIGRWSMIDIFVIAILVALVQLGELATIKAGVGAIYFSGVVVLTMFAAESFDPRLIWDPVEEE
jgi:paraquat-inducible protein A